MDYLSEDNIKRATLQFLKTYYKYRPRGIGETLINMDMQTASGIIADGYFSFPKEDGSPFTATFEATSAAVAQEVRYTTQRKQLSWDSFAVSSVETALLLAFLWDFNLWNLSKAGWVLSLFLVAGIMAVTVFAYQQISKNFYRYRYIYAIEQFKQYHADEQWIAIGYDVFPNPEDPYLVELKSQCVRNGIGLLKVDRDEHLLMLISPAREEVFAHRRRSFGFFSHPISRKLQIDKLGKALGAAPRNFQRFKRPFLAQAMVCLASMVLISGVFYRQWEARPVHYANEREWQASLAQKAKGMRPESPEDNPDKEVQAPNSSGSANVAPGTANVGMEMGSNKEEVGMYVSTVDGYITYDCARADIRGTKYIVQDWVCNSFEAARNRIDQLRRYGLIASCLSLKCSIAASGGGYAVYYEYIYSDFNAANTKGQKIKNELQALHLPSDFVKIRVLHGR